MRQVLLAETARLRDWHAEPLPYLSVLPGRTLARVAGSAIDANNRAIPWSCIVKIIRTPGLARERENDSGSREIQAYRSSLLADLPGPLRAPRVLAINEDGNSRTWLWLEELHDVYGRRWPFEQFAVAARHLGVFNGAYLVSRRLPTAAWLNRWLQYRWAEDHAELGRIPNYEAFLQQLTQEPGVQRRFDQTLGPRVLRLLHEQAQFVHILSLLPQTLCHHDAALANLFAQGRADGDLETVAVDWEKIGSGTLGAEIATLVFGTLRRCEFDAERASELDEVVFEGYVAGLREAGWRGAPELARLGYVSAVALRWTVLVGTLRSLLEGAEPVRTSHGLLVPSEQVVEQRVRLSQFLLDRADEAYQLAETLSVANTFRDANASANLNERSSA